MRSGHGAKDRRLCKVQTSMKTILIVTDNLPDQINGVVTTYKNIEACAAMDGYNIVVLHPGWFSYINCPFYNEVKIAYPRNLGKKIEEICPDHIHIATEGPLGLWARAYLSLDTGVTGGIVTGKQIGRAHV